MLTEDPILPPPAASEEAKAYLRVEGSGEDALVGRLVTTAAELCEQFTGQALIARGFSETLPASGAWTRLSATPVVAIAGVDAVEPDGTATPLVAGAYAIDIDANGDGWVRATQPGSARRIRVGYEAGLAADWAALPEALRQGIVRLTAHFFTHRDAADETGPPAAVTALWRPWRRMRLR